MIIVCKIVVFFFKIKVVKLSFDKFFKWSLGWNFLIYCDNRIILLDIEVWIFIKKVLVKVIKKQFFEVDLIVGVVIVGIVQGVFVVDVFNLLFVYVCLKFKEYGMGNQIEGKIEKGQKVVVLEDLIFIGGSSLKVVDVLRE